MAVAPGYAHLPSIKFLHLDIPIPIGTLKTTAPNSKKYLYLDFEFLNPMTIIIELIQCLKPKRKSRKDL